MSNDYYYGMNETNLSQTIMEMGQTVNLAFLEPTEFDSQRQDYALEGKQQSRHPVTVEIAGSAPVWCVINL